MSEYITIKITKELFDKLYPQIDWYEVKELTIKDELFDNDAIHKALLKESIKAYNNLKSYEFKSRHGK